MVRSCHEDDHRRGPPIGCAEAASRRARFPGWDGAGDRSGRRTAGGRRTFAGANGGRTLRRPFHGRHRREAHGRTGSRADREDAALKDVAALPAHAILETYAVMTRLPGGLALPSSMAAEGIARRFPDRPLHLPDADRDALLSKLSSSDVFGGATYDGLVGLEAAAHGQTLMTLDRRAQETYRRLQVPYEIITL